MRILFALLCLPLPAVAQDEAPMTTEDFQARMMATAQEAGPARLPVACGGLFRALRIISEEGTAPAEQFGGQERDMAMFATVMHKKEEGGTNEEAMDAVFPHMGNVSALYLTQMTRNRKATGKILGPTIRANFDYCSGLHERLSEAFNQ